MKKIFLLRCVLPTVLLLLAVNIHALPSRDVDPEEVLSIAMARNNITTALTGHYVWRHGLMETIYSGALFTGSLDHNTCAFGNWLNSEYARNLTDPVIVSLRDSIIEPHRFIHTEARIILFLLESGEDEEALRIFREEVLPATQIVINGLSEINNYYGVLLNNLFM